jgi:hypothetical protein
LEAFVWLFRVVLPTPTSRVSAGSTTFRPVAPAAVLVTNGAPVAIGYGPVRNDGRPPPMEADVVPLTRDMTTKLRGASWLARTIFKSIDSLRAVAEL